MQGTMKRCAIYTRKSIEPRPQQDLNSLDAQRAICSAYITSQRHKGWVELAKHYDDAGRSGASLDRPQLQDLLADVEVLIAERARHSAASRRNHVYGVVAHARENLFSRSQGRQRLLLAVAV